MCRLGSRGRRDAALPSSRAACPLAGRLIVHVREQIAPGFDLSNPAPTQDRGEDDGNGAPIANVDNQSATREGRYAMGGRVVPAEWRCRWGRFRAVSVWCRGG